MHISIPVIPKYVNITFFFRHHHHHRQRKKKMRLMTSVRDTLLFQGLKEKPYVGHVGKIITQMNSGSAVIFARSGSMGNV